MDVIINNATPAAPVQVAPALPQYLPQQAVPYGYGPYAFRDHDGPPIGLFVLLGVGALLFFRRRGRWERRLASAGGRPGSSAEDLWQRGRARLLGDRALDIARERYARGEINADEYAALRRDLGGEDAGNAATTKPGDGTKAGE